MRAPRVAVLRGVAIRVIRSAKAATDPLGDRRRWGLVSIQLTGGERPAEGVAVLESGVHPLTARRAAHVGSVAGQQQLAVPEVNGDLVTVAEP